MNVFVMIENPIYRSYADNRKSKGWRHHTWERAPSVSIHNKIAGGIVRCSIML